MAARLSNSLSDSDVLLFSEFKNILSILYFNWICYIVVYFLLISFAWCKEYITWQISFNKFLNALPAYTCARATFILWSICLGLHILRLVWWQTLATQANSKGSPFSFNCFIKIKDFFKNVNSFIRSFFFRNFLSINCIS